jgi:GNAT superfamily N-acetyltransferase
VTELPRLSIRVERRYRGQWAPVSPTGAMTISAEARTWARRVIGATGSLIRVQWFVKNVAPASSTGSEPLIPQGVSVRVGSPDDAAALVPLIQGRESIAWRFARGDLLLVAELGDQIVGCTWLTTRPLRPSYFPIKVRPGPGEWYNYGLALLRQHRARGLGRMLSRMAMTEVGRRGGTLIFGHASRFNRVAAASHVAAGYVTVEELIGLTVLNRFTIVLYRWARRTSNPQVDVTVTVQGRDRPA